MSDRHGVGAHRRRARGEDGPTGPVPLGIPAFDEHRPPSAELVADCVHCGFCLPTCPTYALWGEEMDSPRGRIHLMNQGLSGEPMTDSMVQHFDACLGCMACVTGVPVRRAVRPAHRGHPRAGRAPARALGEGPAAARGDLRAVPVPAPAAGAARAAAGLPADRPAALVRRSGLLARLSPTLAAMEDLAPPVGRTRALPERVAARGTRRAVVGMLTGCVQREFFPDVNAATARVLALEGCDVVIPAPAGLLRRAVRAQRPRAGGAGLRPGADRRVRGRRRRAGRRQRGRLRLVHEGVRRAARRRPGVRGPRGRLRRQGARRRRVARRARAGGRRGTRCRSPSPTTTPATWRTPRASAPSRASCCGRSRAWSWPRSPRRRSAAARPASTTCSTRSRPRELGDRKAGNVLATGAELLVTANPGCLMQIAASLRRQGGRIGLAHTVEVLDASLRGLPVAQLTESAAVPAVRS